MNSSSSSAHIPVRDTLPMSVADMTFLVNRLGQDCSPLQHIRELTENAIQGVEQLGGVGGEVIWDVDWNHFAFSDGVYKLACIDTGAGMTGPEMVEYINKLSSSIHEQSATGNFGVGAKVSAAPRNPHGLVYLSWKNGIGHMIYLWFDPEERVYGLKRWPQNNSEFWTPVSDEVKPDAIKDHGTVVVLMGTSDEDNTMDPPQGTPMKSRWVLRYLNTRYFRFPQGVSVKAREGWELPRDDKRHNFLREVHGQGSWLDANSECKGSLKILNATAHWWIIREDVDRDSGHNAGGGHVAALHQDELYEMVTGRAGFARLQGFGVIFGASRVVIYIEPSSSDDRSVTSNTARTQLMIGGEPLPWTEWAGEFRENMPDELSRLQDELSQKFGETDHKKAIHERLKQISDLLRFTRLRPSSDGKIPMDSDSRNFGGQPQQNERQNNSTTRSGGGKGGRTGDIYALFAESGDELGNPVDGIAEPDVTWLSVENHSRTPPDLDDRAGRFLVAQNTLLINGDFRVFTDMVDRWVQKYEDVPGARAIVVDTVREWFEQQLVEAVMSAMALRKTGRWSLQELERLWSEDALTAAVLPRWHIDQNIKRSLGNRLGSRRESPSA